MRRICGFDRCTSAAGKPGAQPRRAVSVWELILALPALLVFLAALVEFGLILANTKVVALASRAGAKVAAESSTPFTASSVTDVKSAVDAVLGSANMESCRVILDHNVPAGSASPMTKGTCSSDCTAVPGPPLPPAAGGTLGAVKVTVCVELSELTPNLLATFGFSTAKRQVREATVFPYEP